MKKLMFPILLILVMGVGCAPGGPSCIPSIPAINSFSASPSSISAGESSTLSWNVAGATTVSIDQGIGNVALTGSRTVTPSVTTLYTLTATNAVGVSATATAQVVVTGAPSPPPPVGLPIINSFTASPGSITVGWSSTLSWNVSNATSVSIAGVGAVALVGTAPVVPTVTTTYILTATNAAGSVTAATQVIVLGVSPPPPPPPPSFAVTSVTASVSPSSFTGACPKTFNFSAVITVNGPGTVTYKWERSDGAIAPTQSITFGAAGPQTVTTTWTLSPPSYTGWERVRILTPNEMVSNQANFTLTCTPGFAVTSVTASVSPSSFTGACPKTFNFSAVITVNGPGTVTYKWERSDGAIAPTQSITFGAAGPQTVTTTWTLSPPSYTGWERVRILTPNEMVSNQANFTLTCAAPFAVTSVTASVSPSSFTGACPKTFNFSAVITVNGPGTVTYKWERSDGAIAPTQSITFAAAGSQTVTTSWTLGASGTRWQRLHVLTPNDMVSNQANFTLTCTP